MRCKLVAFLIGFILLPAFDCVKGGEANAQQIASTDPLEVCGRTATGLTYSRAHRHAHPLPPLKNNERDHIVPLCLGGADTLKNMMYQPLKDARKKDRLEAYACRQVCRRKTIPLATAQAWFSPGPDAWVLTYEKIFPTR